MNGRRTVRAVGGAAVALAVLAFAPRASARAPEIPPSPARFVTDNAGVLSAQTESALSTQLADYERQSGHQVVVYVGVTSGDVPIEEWTVRAFERWGIGQKGKDDGVLLAIFRDDRRARIEVGYGLEDKLTDLQSNRILQEQVLPRMRAGDPNGAVTSGVQAILAGIEGRAPPPPASGAEYGPEKIELTPLQMVILGILGLIFLAFLITHPRMAMWLLWTVATSSGRGRGGGGWGGGGGGGFGGGGGRSGGGGASGSW